MVCKWEFAVDGEGWKTFYQGQEFKGDFYIKIKKVEGMKARGEIYIDRGNTIGQSYHNQWHKFVAVLSEVDGGIALDFQISTFMIVHLEARGDLMTGTGIATASGTLSLKKASSCGK